jgi:tetratricopeptide (TPR) repeat protein
MNSVDTPARSCFSTLLALLAMFLFAFLLLFVIAMIITLGAEFQIPNEIVMVCIFGPLVTLPFVWLWLVRTPSAHSQIKNLTRRLEEKPDDLTLLKQRATLYWQSSALFGGEEAYQLAQNDLEHILTLDPTDSEALELQIDLYSLMENYPKAIQSNERLLEVRGENEETLDSYYEYLFDIYSEQEKYKDLSRLLEDDLLQRPAYATTILRWLIDTYEELGHDSEVLATYKRYQAAGGELTSYDRDRLKKLKGR